MNAQGFYKLDGILCYGPNFVINANYQLRIENKDTYEYPTDGWYYFEDENAARQFFNLPLLVLNADGDWIES
jgi:hypothetical protein